LASIVVSPKTFPIVRGNAPSAVVEASEAPGAAEVPAQPVRTRAVAAARAASARYRDTEDLLRVR
jgi:hypothetical protein